MPRDLPIGNGHLLINFDLDYNIRDVYYPHVGDGYFQISKDVERVPGNPWIISTLSIAQWYAARAKEETDLQPAIDVLEWAVKRARLSGVLAEQVDPFTGAPLSVAPLTWSHAAFVLAAHQISDRMRTLSRKPRSGVERRRVEEAVT